MAPARPGQGADLSASIEITLEQAAGAEKVEAIFPNGRHLKIKLPRYVEDGQTIRLKGQGEPMMGGTAGDALVTIRFKPHSRFRLEGRDVHVDLPVDLADAVLGGKQEIETLDGRIAVRVPAWSSSDRVLRLKERAFRSRRAGAAIFMSMCASCCPKAATRNWKSSCKSANRPESVFNRLKPDVVSLRQ